MFDTEDEGEEAEPIAHEGEVVGSYLLLWSMRTIQSLSRLLLGLAGPNADEYIEKIGDEQLLVSDGEAEPSMWLVLIAPPPLQLLGFEPFSICPEVLVFSQ